MQTDLETERCDLAVACRVLAHRGLVEDVLGHISLRVDDRRVVNGIFYILRTGSPWRDLPERYGPYTTVYNRYNRWAKAGVWLRIFEALTLRSPESLHLIDSSIVRAHQHAAGGKKGVRITPSAVLVAD